MNQSFSSKEKVAILLINLGPEVAADILAHFGEHEIKEISDIILSMRNVSNEVSVNVLNEFMDVVMKFRLMFSMSLWMKLIHCVEVKKLLM